MNADEELHRHAVENLNRADALLFGRVTYEMMEVAFRPTWTGQMPDWMEPFRRAIDATKKHVVSSTLTQVVECGIGTWRFEGGCSAAQAAAGEGADDGRCEAADGPGGDGIDR